MTWKRVDAWHQKSECGGWIVNKTGGPEPFYMLIRLPAEIVAVGTLKACLAEHEKWIVREGK